MFYFFNHHSLWSVYTNYNHFFIESPSNQQDITVKLKGASATSLTIEWEFHAGNASCQNQTLITITYTKVMNCRNKNASHVNGSAESDCNDRKSYNVSGLLDSNVNHFTFGSLSANRSYNIYVSIESLVCKKIIARAGVVFKTLSAGQ